MSTRAREPNASRGSTGRESRQSAPRPSRHQEFTPNSSAPPEATSPGKIAEHVPAERAGERDQAGQQREHDHAAAQRHRAPDAGPVGADQRDQVGGRVVAGGPAPRSPGGARRGRPAGRPGRPASRRAATASTVTTTSPTTSEAHGHTSAVPAVDDADGDAQGGALVEHGGQGVGGDEGADAGGQREGAGADDVAAVPAASHPLHAPGQRLRERGARRPARAAPGPARGAGWSGRRRRTTWHPSRVQHCSSQAMLSGAISSAPRWSVVGLTGNATAWSRGSSSRPPPDAAAETIEMTRHRRGTPRAAATARRDGWSVLSPTKAGTTVASSVTAPMTADPDRRRRDGPGRAARRAGSGTARATSADARRPRRPAERSTGTLSRGGRGRHWPRPPRCISAAGTSATVDPPRSTSASLAGLHREVAQVRGDQHGGAAGAGVGDHLHGGLDAERVDAVEGLVEQQHPGLVERREDHRQPPAHAVAEAGGDPVRGAAEVEALEQVAGAVLPAVGSRRSRAASWRCSHGVARGTRPPTSGQ